MQSQKANTIRYLNIKIAQHDEDNLQQAHSELQFK